MNPEAKLELLADAESLAYSHIRHSGLCKELANEEWDALATEWAGDILNLLNRRCGDEFTRREAAKQRQEAA